MSKKVVVQAWTQQARNQLQTDRGGFWGVGDLLRGSNVLFDACEALDVDYMLDIKGHPVSQIFSPALDVSGSRYDEVEFLVFESTSQVKDHLVDALKTTNVLTINTNGGPCWPDESSSRWKAFIKSIISPNILFEAHLSRVLPKRPYSAFHFRLGDAGLVRGEQSELRDAIEALERYYEPSDVVITDSIALKKYIKSCKPGVLVSDAEPVHTGLSSDVDTIAQTMSDFFLIAGARAAKSYSVYGGPSGFVVSAARIFDVPLEFIDRKSVSLSTRIVRRLAGLLR